MSKKLFGNFYISEVSKSYTAQRERIDNTPNTEQLENARMLAIKCLQPIRDHYAVGFTPNSWFRSPELERVICKRSFEAWAISRGYLIHNIADRSKSWSEYIERKSHPKGEAADIEVPRISNDELFNWCKHNLEFDQLIREYAKPDDPFSGWVHISYRLDNNRNESFNI